MTKTYTVRDSQGQYMGDDTNRRNAEVTARRAVSCLGGCFVVMVADEIVSLVEKVDNKVEVRRLG